MYPWVYNFITYVEVFNRKLTPLTDVTPPDNQFRQSYYPWESYGLISVAICGNKLHFLLKKPYLIYGNVSGMGLTESTMKNN